MFPTLSIYSQILSLLVPPVDLGDLELAVCHRHLDVAGPKIYLKIIEKKEKRYFHFLSNTCVFAPHPHDVPVEAVVPVHHWRQHEELVPPARVVVVGRGAAELGPAAVADGLAEGLRQ